MQVLADRLLMARGYALALAGVWALYALNRFFLKAAASSTCMGWFFSGYFNDLLAMPSLLSLMSITTILVFGKPLADLRLILTIALVAGLEWEFVAPLYRAGSVTDPADLAMYAVGALAYWGGIRFATRLRVCRLRGEPAGLLEAEGSA